MRQSLASCATALSISLLASANLVGGQAIPPPTGAYNVGARRLAIDFVNKPDPVSPDGVSTQYLVTFYYPTLDEPSPATSYVDTELADLYADFGYAIADLTSTVRWNASYLYEAVGPTILFSPGGWGPPTQGQTIISSELASQGYVVAAIDHVYEQPFLRFPNGTGVYGLAIDYPGYDNEFLEALHAVRVREGLHLIDNLASIANSLGAPFETTNLGAFGHSIGGSAALTWALERDAVSAAINEDGTNWGRLNSTSCSDLGKPSMMIGFEEHTDVIDAPHNTEIDVTWANYKKWQTGWWRLITVNGASHGDWSDAAFWKLFGTRPPTAIDGRRVIDITRRYVTAFFDQHLRGIEQDILDGQVENYPEVHFWDVQP